MYKVNFTIHRTRDRVQQIKSIRLLTGWYLKEAKEFSDTVYAWNDNKIENYPHETAITDHMWTEFLAYYVAGKCEGTLTINNAEKI